MRFEKLARVFAFGALLTASAAHAALIQGLPTSPAGSPANPTPLFGTLIDFDDQATGTLMAINQYIGAGVTSITNSVGGVLEYFPSSQSGLNYIGTGFDNNWNADMLFEFTALQAAVGIGIAGPTTLQFELLDGAMNILEGYALQTTPTNTYYFINRASADVRFLRVAGDFVAIDDLQFDVRTVPVPEPATLALLGLALAGLGFSRRKRMQ